MESIYSGCLVRGLPIGVPFKARVYIPEDKRSVFQDDIPVFVVLPVLNSSELEGHIIDLLEFEGHESIENNAEQSERISNAVESLRTSDFWSRCKNTLGNHYDEEMLNLFCNFKPIDMNSAQFKKQKTQKSKSEKVKNTKPRKKRKGAEYYDDEWQNVKPKKLKAIEADVDETENGESTRRRSSRMQAVGFRPDYVAIEKEMDDYDCDTASNSPSEDICENFESNGNTIIKQEEVSDYEDIKPGTDELDKCSESYKQEMTAKESSVDRDPDFNPTEEMDDDADDDAVSSKTKAKPYWKKQICTKSNAGQTPLKKGNSKKLKKDPGLGKLKVKLKVKDISKVIVKERIKVTLEDHPDKYREDVIQSYARKDRGKAKEDCSVKLFVCTVCEKFKTEDTVVLENHIEKHVNGELHCEECDFIGAYIGDIQKHRRLVHKKNIYICSECGREIVNGKDGLKDHLGKDHDKPQWDCSYCLKGKGEHFACMTKEHLKKHVRSEHADKMEQCDGCKRLFASKFHLQKHINIGCSGDAPPKAYPCEKCGKTYPTLRQVAIHIARVHSNVRRYQCPHCQFASSSCGGLSQHLHTHTGYHPHKCDQCSFTCVQRFQLTSHMRTHTGEKPYKCSMCNYAAAWNVQLKDHVRVHSLPDTVSCEECSIVFKDTRGLKNHQRKEHSPKVSESASNLEGNG